MNTLQNMKNKNIISRTKTPESARKEVFRLLWRIISYNGILPIGCVICAEQNLSCATKLGYGDICIDCHQSFTEPDDKIKLSPAYNDILRLSKLGFISPLSFNENKEYSEILELSEKI